MSAEPFRLSAEQFRAREAMARDATPCWWGSRHPGYLIPVVFPPTIGTEREPVIIRTCAGHEAFTRKAVLEHPDLDWTRYR